MAFKRDMKHSAQESALVVCAMSGGSCAFLVFFMAFWITIASTCLEACWLIHSVCYSSQPTPINIQKPSERNHMLYAFTTQTDGFNQQNQCDCDSLYVAKCAKCNFVLDCWFKASMATVRFHTAWFHFHFHVELACMGNEVHPS